MIYTLFFLEMPSSQMQLILRPSNPWFLQFVYFLLKLRRISFAFIITTFLYTLFQKMCQKSILIDLCRQCLVSKINLLTLGKVRDPIMNSKVKLETSEKKMRKNYKSLQDFLQFEKSKTRVVLQLVKFQTGGHHLEMRRDQNLSL